MTRAERRKNPDYRIAELEAELERLRAELHATIKDLETQHAEIERLREENEHLTKWLDKWRVLAEDSYPYDSPTLARLRRIEEAVPLALKALQLCADNHADHSFEETDQAIAALRAALDQK